jgi:drug/metabolite transporter (DMT)-like permease
VSQQNVTISHHRNNLRTRACILLLLATLFWGISFPLIKAVALLQQEAVPHASSWFISALTLCTRFSGGTVLLLLFCLPTLRHFSRSELVQGLGLGLITGIGMLLQNDGMIYTTASTSAFLTQFYCLVVPLAIALHAQRWPSRATALSCVLIMAGVALLANFDPRRISIGRGEAETLLAACFFAGQILWLQRRVFHGNRALHATLVMFAVIAVMMLLGALLTARQPNDLVTANAPRAVWWLMCVLIFFSTVMSFILMNAWQHYAGAVQASLIYGSEPLYASIAALFLPGWFSALWGIEYSNETATARLLLGGALIAIANIVIAMQPTEGAHPQLVAQLNLEVVKE